MLSASHDEYDERQSCTRQIEIVCSGKILAQEIIPSCCWCRWLVPGLPIPSDSPGFPWIQDSSRNLAVDMIGRAFICQLVAKCFNIFKLHLIPERALSHVNRVNKSTRSIPRNSHFILPDF